MGESEVGLLERAREYEAKQAEAIPEDARPVFHLTPRAGWMNDPNGFSFYKGQWHLFYQYYPYDTAWGPMHWGHAVSDDLISWVYRPVVLAPDRDYDREGCWSGSAALLPDGRQLLVYTGRQPVETDEGVEIRQVQCAAIGDGKDYEKYEDNPVITGEGLPEGASIYDFRDPKIWRNERDGCYEMVAASRAADGHGQVLFYRSRDGFHWDYMSTLDASRGEYGSMWECPDFFRLGGEDYILVSPQEMKQEAPFMNPHGNIYIRGHYDEDRHEFVRSDVQVLDYGYDFYAAQTVLSDDGRRILIAWMQAWENARTRGWPGGWAGQMTIPRELEVRNGYLIQNPVRELGSRRINPVSYDGQIIKEQTGLPGVKGRTADLEISISPGASKAYEYIEIRLAEGKYQGKDCFSLLRYEPASAAIIFDRSQSGYGRDALPVRRIRRDLTEGTDPLEIKFRILLDRFSIEIFADGGRYAVSSAIDTPLEAEGISFAAKGEAVIDVHKYDISPGSRAERALSSMTIEETKRMMIAVCDRIIREKPCLTRLDSPIGDADHGIGMSRGMGAARKKLLENEDYQDINQIFITLGRTMISTMGGSSGVVFGTMFAGAVKGLESSDCLTADLFCKMMRQGLTQVQKRGKAVPGDKTMVDALTPAVETMEEALAETGSAGLEKTGPERPDLAEVFRLASLAAKEGAEATRDMVARHGHSKTLGRRSLGHPDPGAVSVYFIFDAMREEAEKIAEQ